VVAETLELDDKAKVLMLAKVVWMLLRELSTICVMAMPWLMFLLACAKPNIFAFKVLDIPMPEGSSAELLMRFNVDKRCVDVAMAVLAAAMALPAIKALMFEFPDAIVVIKVFQQKVLNFLIQALKYLAVGPNQ
jgi:hypothetical protein